MHYPTQLPAIAEYFPSAPWPNITLAPGTYPAPQPTGLQTASFSEISAESDTSLPNTASVKKACRSAFYCKRSFPLHGFNSTVDVTVHNKRRCVSSEDSRKTCRVSQTMPTCKVTVMQSEIHSVSPTQHSSTKRRWNYIQRAGNQLARSHVTARTNIMSVFLPDSRPQSATISPEHTAHVNF